jgi:uncharacterized protein YneF (UPF0154 family)
MMIETTIYRNFHRLTEKDVKMVHIFSQMGDKVGEQTVNGISSRVKESMKE